MLIVTKRSGKTEPFVAEKIRNTLEVTSDEAGQPLNASDLNSILREVQEMLQEKETITSYQIYTLVVGILYVRGLKKLLELYTCNKKNAWR